MSAPKVGLGGAVVGAVSGEIPSAFRSSESKSPEDPGPTEKDLKFAIGSK